MAVGIRKLSLPGTKLFGSFWFLASTVLIISTARADPQYSWYAVQKKPPTPAHVVINEPATGRFKVSVHVGSGHEELASLPDGVSVSWAITAVTKDGGADTPALHADVTPATGSGMLLDWTATFPSTGKYSITYTATLTGPGPSVITNGPKAVTCDPADDVEDVAVNFDPGDLRPGVGSGRTATLTASAHVAAATANAITVSLSIDNGKASCSPSSLAIAAGQTQNTQSVTVTGNQKSDKDRDTHIIAQVGGNEKARSDITVTIPNRWTSSAISGAVSCKIPSLHPDSANNNLARARYTQTITITVQDQFGKALSGVWSAAPAVTLEENGGGGWLGLQPDNNGNFPPTPVPSGGAVQDPLISDYPSVGWWTVGQVGDAISGSWTPPDGDPSSVDLTYEVNDGGTTFALQSTNHRVMTYIAGVRSWKDNKQ